MKNHYKFRPKPFSAFTKLAKICLQCSAQPKTNQRVEGGFSLASMYFRANARNAGPLMWSTIIRKKNVFNYEIGDNVIQAVFTKMFRESLVFGRLNQKKLKMCYAPDTGVTEEKYEVRMLEDMPQYIRKGAAYTVTNICDNTVTKKAIQPRDRNGGQAQTSRHRASSDDESGDKCGGSELLRAPNQRKRRRIVRAAKSPSPVSGWTLDTLNREECKTLRDMCATQQIVVLPSHGSSFVKADYVAAILADQDILHTQHDDQREDSIAIEDVDSSSPVPVADVTVVSKSVVVSIDATMDTTEESSPSPHARKVIGPLDVLVQNVLVVSVEINHASSIPVTAGSTDESGPSLDNSAQRELDSFLLDCANQDIDPFSWDKETDPAELNSLDRGMKARVEDVAMSLDPDSDSEEEAMHTMVRPNRDEEFEKVKAQQVGVWRRTFADALAASSSWKPSTVVSTKSITRGAAQAHVQQLGTPLRSATLSRADGKQFTVMGEGCTFFLLNTPGGVELVKISAIFHPMDGEGELKQVWVQYCRVLKGSEALEVCDRADDASRTILSSTGETVVCTSVGSKQIAMQIEERNGKKLQELYHWGDVFFVTNAENLLGAVYWVTKANENDLVIDEKFKGDLLRGIKDKIPITGLKQMDYVVVGTSFSDTKS